jgi:CheY-like chemotaxis protein/predicted regulator of Ras-like GTPase activity (Roadblock/LC7/MglB family)
MAARRRILILDDEASVAFFLRESLEALGFDFEVVSVSSSDDALREINQSKFDLLVTDHRMPGMKGLELVETVKKRHGDMRFILITAYGSEDVLKEARNLGAFQFFTKPFRIDDFVQTVVDALENGDGPPRESLTDQQPDVLSVRLEELRREVGAQCVLASGPDGAVIVQAGSLTGLDLERLLQLATDWCVSSSAIGTYVGGDQTHNLTYFEGVSHDIYLASVEDDLFLVLVFDRQVQASRVGIVWLYARRAIENLRRVRSAFPVGVDMTTQP